MGLVFIVALMFFSPAIAAILAITARLLLTGALHEDGLADFCDGMGGGTSRKRILEIMKDSHIGTYGVIGLIVYFMLMASLLSSLSQPDTPLQTFLTILTADTYCKCISSLLIAQLPYARKDSEAKIQTSYAPMKISHHLPRILIALLPCIGLSMLTDEDILCGGFSTSILAYIIVALTPLAAELIIMRMIKKRIGGYTGDCCGAMFLICETTLYLTLALCF